MPFGLCTWMNPRNHVLDEGLEVLRDVLRYGDGAGNTVEENSSVFFLIRMH